MQTQELKPLVLATIKDPVIASSVHSYILLNISEKAAKAYRNWVDNGLKEDAEDIWVKISS
jgi:hypothetical protein